jgi:hypothetical protein
MAAGFEAVCGPQAESWRSPNRLILWVGIQHPLKCPNRSAYCGAFLAHYLGFYCFLARLRHSTSPGSTASLALAARDCEGRQRP